MPDVGILNLQIRDDSAKAAEGLKQLVTRLEEMKNATSKIRLGTVASGIKRINDELSKVQPSAIYKLKQLADVLEKIGSISGNVGGIRISFGGRGQSIEDIATQMKAARDAVAQTTAGFEQIGQRMQEDVQGAEAFANTMGRVNEIVQQTGFSANNTAEQFSKMFRAMNSMRMSRSLGDGSFVDWTYWKGGAIEVEGTVTDAMDAIRVGSGEAIPLLTGVVDATAEIASSAQEMAEESETFANTASEFDSVTQSVQQTTEAIQEYNEAIEFARRWNASSTSAGGYKGQESADIEYVNSLIESASQADLLAMRIDALRDKLYQMAGSGKATGDQIARMVSQIQGLQEKLDKLNSTTEDVKKSFSEIMAESGGLNGAFKRMFPTISGLLTRFKQIVKYRMLRAVLRHITEGFSEGVQNVYQYSKAVGTSLAPAMDAGATALQQMKNSIGAAVAPVIQALVPVLQNVVNWFINLLNYANQFFALMNGQNTWTRALPEAAEAYEKTAKNAKAASKATKDLLADWDELNIIQSNSGSGTGSGTGKTAKEYSQMFEEVSEFSEKVKKVVDYINEHLGGIPAILKKAGLVLLGWKLSKAFTNGINALNGLIAAGGIMLTIQGIELASSGGYDIGQNGLTKDNLIKTVYGILETGFGAGAVGIALAGIKGGLIGLTIGTIAGLLITAINIDKGYKDSLYGSVSKTQEDIRAELEKNFITAEAQVQIDVLHAHLKSVEDAENKVSEAVNDINKTYPVSVVINPDNAEDFKEKVDALVDATNELINESSATLKEIHVPATAAFTSDFVDKSWANVSTYVTELGKKIGEELDKNIQDNVKLDELREKLLNISSTILTATKSSEFSGSVGLIGASLRSDNFANYNRETVMAYASEYNKLAAEKMAEATGYARADFVEQKRLIAALEESIEEGAGVLDEDKINEMKEQLKVARAELLETYGENGEKLADRAKELYDEWTKAGREQYISDLIGAFSSAAGKATNFRTDVGASTLNKDNLLQWFRQNLGVNIGMGNFGDEANKEFVNLLGDAGISGWEILTNDLKRKYIKQITKTLGRTSDTYRQMKDQLGVPIDEILAVDKSEWDKWTNKTQILYIKSLVDAYGEDAVRTAFAKFGYDLDSMLEFTGQTKGSSTVPIIDPDYKYPWTFTPPTEEELEEQNRNKEKYKPFWEFEPPEEAVPLEVEFEVKPEIENMNEAIESIYSDIRQSILKSGVDNKTEMLGSLVDLYNSGSLDTLKTWQQKINEFGIVDAYDQLLNYINGDDWTLGSNTNFPKGRLIASAGVSDVGFAPYRSYEPAGSEPFSSGFDLEAEVEDHETPEEKQANIRLGTNGLLEALNSILTVAQAINRKEFTVNIAPSSAFGSLGAKSAEAYGKVTG